MDAQAQTTAPPSCSGEPTYHRLRMTAEEYFGLEDDGFRYELVDGVLCMSPSPTSRHQETVSLLVFQVAAYLDQNAVGRVFPDLDVRLRKGAPGSDLVYRPDLAFVRSEHDDRIGDHITGPPDLVVEVVSPASRRYDNETKKDDYERCGVFKYWIIDPERSEMTFYRLSEGRYAAVQPEGDSFASEAVPGFRLDLARLRRGFAK